MRKAFQDQLFLLPNKEVDDVIGFVDMYHNERDLFRKICDGTWNEKHRELIKNGFFKVEHVCEVMAKSRGEEDWSHKPILVETALAKLSDWALITDLRTIIPGIDAPQFRIFDDATTKRWSKSFAEDIVKGPLFFIQKYRPSLPAITVLTSKGDESIATGFLIFVDKENFRHALLITNQHVTQDGKIEKILSINAEGAEYTWSDIVNSTKFDLSAIKVVPPRGAHGFTVFDVSLLEDVLALGYPKVAVSAEPTLLVHKGEVNGTVRNRHDGNNYLAISCAVAPGNSGGPILNEGANVVGIVSTSSIGKYLSGSGDTATTEIGVHHLAIPATDLRHFINVEVFPKL